jgi:hypothetical protein
MSLMAVGALGHGEPQPLCDNSFPGIFLWRSKRGGPLLFFILERGRSAERYRLILGDHMRDGTTARFPGGQFRNVFDTNRLELVLRPTTRGPWVLSTSASQYSAISRTCPSW